MTLRFDRARPDDAVSVFLVCEIDLLFCLILPLLLKLMASGILPNSYVIRPVIASEPERGCEVLVSLSLLSTFHVGLTRFKRKV